MFLWWRGEVRGLTRPRTAWTRIGRARPPVVPGQLSLTEPHLRTKCGDETLAGRDGRRPPAPAGSHQAGRGCQRGGPGGLGSAHCGPEGRQGGPEV